MIEIEFKTGDDRTVAVRNLAAVPRVGDSVVLSGREFSHHAAHGEVGTEMFRVYAVVHDSTNDGDDFDCSVVAWVESEEGTWSPRCACETGEQIPQFDGECGNCGHSLSRNVQHPLDKLLADFFVALDGGDEPATITRRINLATDIAVRLLKERRGVVDEILRRRTK